MKEKGVSIVEHDSKVNALVQTCSECCMETINGKVNINGMLHRALFRDPRGYMRCCECPVHLRSVATGEFDMILRALDGEK